MAGFPDMGYPYPGFPYLDRPYLVRPHMAGLCMVNRVSHKWIFHIHDLPLLSRKQSRTIIDGIFWVFSAQNAIIIMPLFGGLEKCCFLGKSRFWATLTRRMINHLPPLSNKRYRKKKYAFLTLIGTFILGVNKRAAASKQPSQDRGYTR